MPFNAVMFLMPLNKLLSSIFIFFSVFLFCRLTDKAPKEYAVYRSPLLFWGLVDLVYDMFRVIVQLQF